MITHLIDGKPVTSKTVFEDHNPATGEFRVDYGPLGAIAFRFVSR
jgi:hypothetical protein